MIHFWSKCLRKSYSFLNRILVSCMILIFFRFLIGVDPMSAELGSTGVATSLEQMEVPFTSRRRVNVCRSGCDYSMLSEAVAHSEDYDLILVEADTYIDCA